MSGLFDQITNYSPPLLTAGQVNYKGTWSAAANSPTLVSPPASTSKGDYYVVSAAGTQFGITFAVGDWIISNGTAWEKVDLTDAVSSVFGRTGAITAASGDYTASQVTNVPAGTISSTNVQDAINELSSDIATAQNVLDAYVTNAESVAITRGQVVYAFGATGNRMSVKLAYNTSDATSAKTVGVVLDSSIAAGNPGYIRLVGVVDGLNLGTFADGDTLYLGATNGSVTATKPYAPNHLVYVGIVERANNGNGQLYVRVQNGYELDEIHDVQITSAPASGALLVRDATNSLWKAARLTAGTNIAVTNADASVTVGVTGIIGSSNGGTGNGFTKFSGPATSEKTFTLPNSNATLLYEGGTIGATTANTGAFTTLSASTTTLASGTRLTIDTSIYQGIDIFRGDTNANYSGIRFRNNANSATNAQIGWSGTSLRLEGSSVDVVGALSATGTITSNPASGNNITLQNGGGVEIGSIFNDAGYLNLKATTNVSGLRLEHTNHVYQRIGGSVITDVSSTGLAVTGTLSSTGQLTITGSTTNGTTGAKVVNTNASGFSTLDLQNTGTSGRSYSVGVGGNTAAANANAFYIYDGTAAATRLILDSSGNVGIGTTSPATKLQVLGLENSNQQINSVGTNYGSGAFLNAFSSAGGNAQGFAGFIASQSLQTNRLYTGVHSPSGVNQAFIGTPDSNPLAFWTAGSERARIDSSGNLLVGRTSIINAASSSDVGITLAAQYNTIQAFRDSDGAMQIGRQGSDGPAVTFWKSGTNVGYISLTSTVTTYVSISDYRRKFNVKDLTGSGSFIDALKPRTFDWDTGDKGVGFIAHEFAEVSPTSVCGEKDAVDADGKPIYQAMQASSAEVIANLVAELQSLRQRVAALESN